MQSSSSSRVFNPTLAGASPATDANLWLNANCSQGVISSARRSAKAEVRGANPRESASFKALVPQQLQGGFRKPVWWPPAKARCESDQGPHFNQGRDVIASISACDADCAGANPVALTISLRLNETI
jgi:hypothetical protein